MGHPTLDGYDAWRRGQGGGKPPTGAEQFARLVELNETLARSRVPFPEMTDWWLEVIGNFWRSGKRWLILRVGRRGGKSTSVCRMAVVEVLYGNWNIPPGDIGFWPFISTTRKEANMRLVTVRAILDAIGVRYRPVEDGIVLEGRNVGFRTYVATIAGVSGLTSLGFSGHEVAKWKDSDSGSNPAHEVIHSLRPTMAGVPGAKGILESSPWSTLDAHAEAFDIGDTEDQMVAWAPTWIARPSLTEAMCRELERDEPSFQREYGAIPMGAGESGFFDHGAIDAAAKRGAGIVMPVAAAPGTVVTAGGDLAFERDCATLAIAHRTGEWADDASTYLIADLLEKRPRPSEPLMPGEVISDFADKLKWHHCGWMMADGHYRMSAVEHLQKHNLTFADAPQGQRGKAESYVRMRIVLHGGRLTIPDHPTIVKQLKEVTSKPTAGGGLSLSSPHKSGGGHGDLVSSVVLAVWQPAGYVVPMGAPKPGTPEHAAIVEDEMLRKRQREQRAKNRGSEWWKK